MTAERYAAFVRVQHLAARHCRDAAAAEDPVAQLLQMTLTSGADGACSAAGGAECGDTGERVCTRTPEPSPREVRPDS